jgi:UDP-N-acetylglucosamine pyrophosphorylase
MSPRKRSPSTPAAHPNRLHHSSPQKVKREDHFAPVKNAPGSDTDSPDTARALLLGQGARWAAAAGAAVAPGCCGLEVPAGVSYAGEGLGAVVKGLAVPAPGPWLLAPDGTLSAGKA